METLNQQVPNIDVSKTGGEPLQKDQQMPNSEFFVHTKRRFYKDTIDPSIPLITSQSQNSRDDAPNTQVNYKLITTSKSLNFDMPNLDLPIAIR